ncbi:ThiF family adenylyltransferase [Streptomyces sp. B1I3]|uniref:ThiF family adenylyltransferase n=1 Tax=Streptomyces sp. B1I3 TaxID=3042264 RepID=UPI0027851FB0|nr:ThiF family adenylyltransferase [Streptomyces sp. B1I3]MDQ0797260.1 hypothetical protein [Streptomyces sp. B1I3]
MAVHETECETLLNLGDRLLRVGGPQPRVRAALDRLRTGTTQDRLAADWAPGAVAALLAELRDQGWLTGESEEERAAFAGETYERQVDHLALFGPDTAAAQRRLLGSRVAVIGLGGIGGIVTQHLVGAGVSRFWLVDDDCVAGHNLNRQFTYGSQDIGSPKTRALARSLSALRPGIRTTGVRKRITEAAQLFDELPGDLDLVIVAADTPPGLPDVVWEWAVATGTPTAVAAVGVGIGFWGPVLVPARDGCWPCFERGRRAVLTGLERTVEDRSAEPAPFSFGPSNTVIAAMLAHDVVEFLCSGSCPTLGRRAALDFRRQRITHSEEMKCSCPTT